MTLTIRLAATFGVYFAASLLALQIVAHPQGVAYFWPAAGVAAGILISTAPRERGYFAAAIAVAVIAANLSAGHGLPESVIFAVANTGEAWLCAALFLGWVGSHTPFRTLAGVNIFILAAAGAALASGVFVALALPPTGASSGPPLITLRTWSFADFVGIVALAPFVVLLHEERARACAARLLEGAVALGIIIVLAYFGGHRAYGAPEWADLTGFALTLPALLWMAARTPGWLAASAPACVALLVIWQTGLSDGLPPQHGYSFDDQMIAARIDIAIFAIMSLQLIAIFAQYRSVLDELARERTQLEQQFNELQTLYAEAPLGLAMLDADMRFIRINEALAEMNGFSVDAHLGRSAWDLVPELRGEAEARLRRVLETGEPLRDVEIHGSTPAQPGIVREWCEQFYPVKMSGRVIGIGVVCEEVTEKRQALDRERLLSREVDHRAKNMLAVVNSIVQLTQSDDVASYREAISGRIQALARTHSLLAGSRWEGSGLTPLLNEELAPFVREGRVTTSGPDAILSPMATQDFALVLHELTTNAAKYGALSSPAGRLVVTWALTPGAYGDDLTFDWRETGGPPVAQPKRRGFGTALLEASVVDHLKGTVDLNWRPDGLSVNIRFPADKALATHRRDTADAHADAPARSDGLAPLRARVLLVEDEPLIGLHARTCLEALGCEVIGPIARLEPAAVAARDAQADVALLDLNIGGQMTFDLAETLQSRGIPCIFCTGYTDRTPLPESLRDVIVLQKPFSESALSDALEQLRGKSPIPQI